MGKKQTSKKKTEQTVPVSVSITKQDLVDAIAEGIRAAKEDRSSADILQEMPTKEKLLWTLKTLFAKKENIKGTRVTTNLLQVTVSFLFKGIWILLWILALCIIGGGVANFWLDFSPALSHLVYFPFFLLYGFLAILFAQLFRIASIEIEKLQDQNMVIGIFTAVIAAITLIITIATK